MTKNLFSFDTYVLYTKYVSFYLDDKRQDLVFFDNGCCRFDDWKSKAHGDLTIDQCLEKCDSDLSCVAADVKDPTGFNYKCFTFEGSLQNLRTECGKTKDARCYARLKPKSKRMKV